MKKRFLTILSVAAALLGAVSCGDLLEMIGLGEEDVNKVTSFSITPNKVTLKAEGGSATIAFTAPDVWSATSDAGWLTVDPSAGKSGETVVTLSASANTGEQRTATLTVESARFRTTVEVTQEAAEGTGPVTPPDGSAKWYVCGNFVDWQAENAIEMSSAGNGIYTLDMDLPEYAEFKFVQDRSWEVNLGATEKGEVGDNNSPAIKAGEVVNLVEGGFNLYFENGGSVTITLDVNAKTAVIKGGNTTPPNPPQGETVWSVIGTVNGTNWDTDFDMSCGGDFWHITLYYEDGQEFKFRSNHSWDGPEFGYGPIIMPEPAVLTAESQGPNITLPWTGYWDLYIFPETAQFQFFPNEDQNWQYFLNPDGSVAQITFTSEVLEVAVPGRIKYYEVNGVRTCKTETGGILGEENGREWYFVWYTDSDRIKLPIQLSGFTYGDYGEATVFSPYYYFGVFAKDSNPDLGDYFSFVENYPSYPEAYYDGNGGFYFGVEWYLFMDYNLGLKPESYDVVAEADGYNRHDYSFTCNSALTRSGYVPLKITAGRDIVSMKYIVVDGQIEDADWVWEQVLGIIDGSIQSEVFDDLTYDDKLAKNTGILKVYGTTGYHTVIAVGYDAKGQDWSYFWWYFPVYAFDATRTWTSLGMGTYTDDYFATLFSLDPETWEVEVQQCNEDPTVIRMVYPYDAKFVYNEDGDYATDKSYDIEINIPDNDHVYILPQDIGVDWGYGMICVMSDPAIDIAMGATVAECVESGLEFGTYADGIITFPVKGLVQNLPDYNFTGLFYGNAHGAFKLVLPGYEETVDPVDGTVTGNGTTSGVARKSAPKAGWSVLRREQPASERLGSSTRRHASRKLVQVD